MKKKLNAEQKAILAYAVELFVFGIVFTILGILRITGVIPYNGTRRVVFNWITLVGCTLGIAEFIWYCFSKRKQRRGFLSDKLAVLALAIFMITYDIICLTGEPTESFCTYMLGSALLYVGVVYLFQGVYHYFKPLPGYLEDIRKAIEEDEANEAKKKAELEANKTQEDNKRIEQDNEKDRK